MTNLHAAEPTIDSGCAHTACVRPANTADITVMSRLIREDDRAVFVLLGLALLYGSRKRLAA